VTIAKAKSFRQSSTCLRISVLYNGNGIHILSAAVKFSLQ